jgi:hypothetical protein
MPILLDYFDAMEGGTAITSGFSFLNSRYLIPLLQLHTQLLIPVVLLCASVWLLFCSFSIPLSP